MFELILRRLCEFIEQPRHNGRSTKGERLSRHLAETAVFILIRMKVDVAVVAPETAARSPVRL